MTSVYRTLLSWRGLVHVVAFAITGEWIPRRHRLVAESLEAAGDAFVVDLGCGEASVLSYFSPRRYVGIDGHAASLAAAEHRHGGPGREWIRADLEHLALSPWHGADVVVVASVCHHLTSEQVQRLLRRIQLEVKPRRILLQDAEATGPLGPLVTLLDDGKHLLPMEELVGLLEADFRVERLWTYRNRLRSFRQFLLGLEPRSGGS